MAAVFVGAFVYLTSVSHWKIADVFRPLAKTTRVWTSPDSAHTATLSSD